MPPSVFDAFPELLNAPPAFGLRAQGKLIVVEQMVREGRSWDENGAAIGWSGEAVERHYGWHLEASDAELQAQATDPRDRCR